MGFGLFRSFAICKLFKKKIMGKRGSLGNHNFMRLFHSTRKTFRGGEKKSTALRVTATSGHTTMIYIPRTQMTSMFEGQPALKTSKTGGPIWVLGITGQISIIPKPELRGFWGSSLIKPPFRVTSADVVIICPEVYKHIYIHDHSCKISGNVFRFQNRFIFFRRGVGCCA